MILYQYCVQIIKFICFVITEHTDVHFVYVWILVQCMQMKHVMVIAVNVENSRKQKWKAFLRLTLQLTQRPLARSALNRRSENTTPGSMESGSMGGIDGVAIDSCTVIVMTLEKFQLQLHNQKPGAECRAGDLQQLSQRISLPSKASPTNAHLQCKFALYTSSAGH